ncbi:MAG TPA: carbohydrate binding domain-containing protein, partial [Terriglobia bacterium]|nr:carbohydrate binding domain-containing protein [Terriglobia bacterium]
MRKRLCILLLTAALATVLAEGDRKPYPYRWVRVASNLRDDSEVERIRQLVTTASEHGLNGMAFSAGLDQLDQKTPDYFQRLKRVREFCAERKVDIIPSFFSAGYGGSVLSHDKNLAAGLPVRDAMFVVSEGKAKFVAEPAVKIANGSFENFQPNHIESFSIEGKPGEVIVDAAGAKEGKASVRFENVGESRRQFVRLSQEVAVQPYRCYRIRCWVKARNMGKSDPF